MRFRCVRRLLVQLEETGRNFDDFWASHELRLSQCLALRRFEDDFRRMQYSVERHLADLAAMTEGGDTAQRVDSLIRELEQFENEAQVSHVPRHAGFCTAEARKKAIYRGIWMTPPRL